MMPLCAWQILKIKWEIVFFVCFLIVKKPYAFSNIRTHGTFWVGMVPGTQDQILQLKLTRAACPWWGRGCRWWGWRRSPGSWRPGRQSWSHWAQPPSSSDLNTYTHSRVRYSLRSSHGIWTMLTTLLWKEKGEMLILFRYRYYVGGSKIKIKYLQAKLNWAKKRKTQISCKKITSGNKKEKN